jgi:hypothetical protein
MKSGLRTGILSDKSVLISCADQQSIPFNKINLAARSGTKISRPQKASYMFNNLNLPQMQKEELINDFVLRSQKAKPLVIPPRQYSTLSLHKPDALVRQVATQTLSADLAQDLVNAVTQTDPRPMSAASDESRGELTESEPRSPRSPDADTPPPDPNNREYLDTLRQGRNHLFDRQNQQEPGSSNPNIYGIRSANNDHNAPLTFGSPVPPGGRQGTHTRFATPQTPAGSGHSAADSLPQTPLHTPAGSGHSAAHSLPSTPFGHYARPTESSINRNGNGHNINPVSMTAHNPQTRTQVAVPPLPLGQNQSMYRPAGYRP